MLNECYSEKSAVAALGKFFEENFKAKGFNIILGEEFTSDNPHFPLYKFRKTIGHVEFLNTNKELEDFLDTALYMISLKVQNLLLSDRMQKNIDFQNSMKNIAKIIESQYELHYIIPIIGEMIDKFIQNHLIYIFLVKNENLELVWPSACNDKKIFDIINARPLKRATTGNIGVFPLICEEKLLGYIATKTMDEKLTCKDIEYIEELTKQSAITINRANVYAEILKHATLDALTGFYNRRQLEERINQEISSSRRQNTPLCAIMTDIDFFKNVNDTYGHAAGDAVLKAVSRVIRTQLREYDIAGRYGGEEFAILLPFTKIDEAKMVAERLRNAVENAVIKINDNEQIHVTISSGIYELKPEDDILLENADKALYEAKKSGRNKVIVYDL